MMAELEVDQTNLPRVQEVCQCFSVLEDGALAHNLQEQEIEQYYSTNIQKNQLVQNDIRVAKKLQDEEEEQWAQQSALHRQVSKQLEERDFEYARLIQEEILRCAEEAQRREQDDEEMAKRIHDEETQCRRRASRGQDNPSEDSAEARLDLGELQQVLQDEELARKMQEDEENRLRRNSSAPSCYPEGDFRVAQVAQDEEIAHFMQKQEMKSKRRSRELEGPSSWREHRAMISHHDRRAARDRDRQGQRERLDSEGLPSPIEDCSPENQPPSPTSTTLQSQHIRNIAEELDPTFQARRLSTERDRDRQTGLDGQTLPVQQHDFLAEPTFVAPTKRQADKSERSKPKEKKENCKQQ
ncbi:coiled-coil domain-containing protein 187 isoform X2 [Takifugu rubripes]|uniref:Coiled-coil domain containing 187 n=1 Tax=Takifugu rubripes TaxID=31033 RepID=A0A674PNJ2_TAKRU|nr:coiled-coil domain-containing protein 50-like isoform X2 [Takifugu rubripes]|eukprot:XP_011600988.1 PREDICTED: coiled-coil domain-containing protein 50-like isoform X2 [Takifugu rubripes]